MLYELCRYDVAAGKLPALIERFNFVIHKWKDHGIRLVGFWTPLLGEKSNQLVYIWVESQNDREDQALPAGTSTRGLEAGLIR